MSDTDDFNELWQKVMGKAEEIGNILAEKYPAVGQDPDYKCYIPEKGVTVVSEVITMMVAEILQSWLDAGSEREVTLEELGSAIEEHVKGWSLPDNEVNILKPKE